MKTRSRNRRPRLAVVWGLVVFSGLLAWAAWYFAGTSLRRLPGRDGSPVSLEVLSEKRVFAAYGGSASCQECHAAAWQQWQGSHHSLAERGWSEAEDRRWFDPPRKIRHGTQESEARWRDGRYELVTAGLEGKKPHPLARVLGVSPIRQFLSPLPGGRYQMTELAVDPTQGDWFNVFGSEDRQPGEWGHWTGRGMNWNQMCAGCHNTRVRKNYRHTTDSYETTMAEQGVGCEACHGPMENHAAWQRRHPGQKSGDPTLTRLTTNQMIHTCGQCHARRAELSDDFQAGRDFYDYYSLVIAGEGETYYPDGQIRDEDYEFTPFIGSRMAQAGVWCLDCHNPHTGKIRARDDSLCMRCHGPPLGTAPKIDGVKHSFHPAGKPGGACVDCHMPLTLYMARHWRRDHGYTIPDPLLTRQHGIPNACSRCHTNQTVDWAVEWTDKWYGARMNRPTRQRAQRVARGVAGQPEAAGALTAMTREEPIALWRAVAVSTLRPWCAQSNVFAALVERLGDASPLVRGKAVRALEPFVQAGDPRVQAALKALLADSARTVRVEAAWVLRRDLDTNSPAGRELAAQLWHNADQPAGLMQCGVFQLDRGDTAGAQETFRRAVEWDPHSAPLHHALAVSLSAAGQTQEALAALETAARLAPRDAEIRFKLGLARHEAGRLDDAVAALEETVKLEPGFAQAWYNLGLARNAQGRIEPALEALQRAESASPGTAAAPYARATILARAGRVEEARQALRRALAADPGHAESVALMSSLSRGGSP